MQHIRRVLAEQSTCPWPPPCRRNDVFWWRLVWKEGLVHWIIIRCHWHVLLSRLVTVAKRLAASILCQSNNALKLC